MNENTSDNSYCGFFTTQVDIWYIKLSHKVKWILIAQHLMQCIWSILAMCHLHWCWAHFHRRISTAEASKPGIIIVMTSFSKVPHWSSTKTTLPSRSSQPCILPQLVFPFQVMKTKMKIAGFIFHKGSIVFLTLPPHDTMSFIKQLLDGTLKADVRTFWLSEGRTKSSEP